MKHFILSVFILLAGLRLNAQCTPENAGTCPDPENNGEICPKILPMGFVGIAYSQVVTILPPPTASFGSSTFPLHKIQVTSIGNMPQGISYVSNSPNNDFLVGTYYCFLISGTPVTPGHYPLKINVDAYAMLFGTPTKVGSAVDSTSLFIDVDWDPNGIAVAEVKGTAITAQFPQPASSNFIISLLHNQSETMEYSVFSLNGSRMLSGYSTINPGANQLEINISELPAGVYFYTLKFRDTVLTGRMLKQ